MTISQLGKKDDWSKLRELSARFSVDGANPLAALRRSTELSTSTTSSMVQSSKSPALSAVSGGASKDIATFDPSLFLVEEDSAACGGKATHTSPRAAVSTMLDPLLSVNSGNLVLPLGPSSGSAGNIRAQAASKVDLADGSV